MRAKRLIWIFLLLQLLFTPFSQLNHNTSSRFAAMGAFCSNGSYEISPYLSETDDWARTPDGKYFSNKAPGTLYLAAPLYCSALKIQRALLPAPKDETERVRNEWKLRFVLNLVLSLFLQILPWLWICFRWDRKLQEWGASTRGRQFAWTALLFGTTPAILMDVWIGHPVVAFFSLLSLLALFEGRAFLLGFSLGMMQLTEYSSVLMFPGALLVFPYSRKKFPRHFVELILGLVIPIALWIAYHQSAFGSPLMIANRFQNPMFQDMAEKSVQLWGVLTLPDLRILARLLFGWWRGILFSQPWVLIALTCLPAFWHDPRSRKASIYGVLGLFLLLLMNASFGGWHGGSVAGPRYLSAALPVLALPVALSWERLSRLARSSLSATLAFSCLAFFLAKVFSPTAGLWPEWIDHLRENPWDFAWKSAFELCVIALIFFSVSPHARDRNS